MEKARRIFQDKTTSQHSLSPFGESYVLPTDALAEKERLINGFKINRPIVVVQGMGFVGAAMSAALVQSRDNSGALNFNVIGVDLLHPDHYWKIARASSGYAPVGSADNAIDQIYESAPAQGNFMATYSEYAYSIADIIIVDVNVDVNRESPGDINEYDVSLHGLNRAISTAAQHMSPEALVLVETTLPPGTTEKVIAPAIREALSDRKLPTDLFKLAYSFERVMPGVSYLNSIISFHRAFAGIDLKSSQKTRQFLESFIDTKLFPLQELNSTTACEMAKVMENSYRATNIAFIEEWTRFAHEADVNLYEVVKSIRVRPTHANIMNPGFGVGGYCLTKDALLGEWGLKNHFENTGGLTFSREAISVNDRMPGQVMELLSQICPDLEGIHLAIMGVSYRQDVADTRNTPVEYFSELCELAGMQLSYHDSLLTYWAERKIPVSNSLSELKNAKVEILVFALPSETYKKLTSENILDLFPELKVVIDANDVLTDETAEALFRSDIRIAGIGKGHWNCYWRGRHA